MVNTGDAKHEGRNFGFPFEPYSIQTDFMASLYDALDNNKIGIFESPTGTVCEKLFSICRSQTSLFKKFKNHLIFSQACKYCFQQSFLFLHFILFPLVFLVLLVRKVLNIVIQAYICCIQSK